MRSKDKSSAARRVENDSKRDTTDMSGQMVPVPGFTPPFNRKKNMPFRPELCSQEDINEFRSAGVLLKTLATEAKAWSEQLPENFRPAIMAILHGGVQVQVRSLAQISFDGIRIEGMMGPNPCSVLAHQNTVQLVCHAVQVDLAEEAQKNPIGFIWPDHDEQI